MGMTEERWNEFLKWAADIDSEATVLEQKKIQDVKKNKEKRRAEEKRLGIKKKKKTVNAPPTHSICPDCIHCCPCPPKGHGCEWSIAFKPVPGWDAIRRDISTPKGKEKFLVSYLVVSCPKFQKG